MIKTRVQTQGVHEPAGPAVTGESTTLLRAPERRLGAMQIAQETYRAEGMSPFYRGLGICSARAFMVNAVQWAIYEWVMHILLVQKPTEDV